jgi:hypothetical protein
MFKSITAIALVISLSACGQTATRSLNPISAPVAPAPISQPIAPAPVSIQQTVRPAAPVGIVGGILGANNIISNNSASFHLISETDITNDELDGLSESGYKLLSQFISVTFKKTGTLSFDGTGYKLNVPKPLFGGKSETYSLGFTANSPLTDSAYKLVNQKVTIQGELNKNQIQVTEVQKRFSLWNPFKNINKGAIIGSLTLKSGKKASDLFVMAEDKKGELFSSPIDKDGDYLLLLPVSGSYMLTVKDKAGKVLAKDTDGREVKRLKKLKIDIALSTL